MSDRDGGDDSSAVIRVGLRRVNLDERVLADSELRGCPFARLFDDDSLRDLIGESTGRRFAHGARIFVEGEPGQSLFLLLKGEARLTTGAGSNAVEVAVVRKGDVMGEREALGERGSRHYTAVAIGEVELIEFPRTVVSATAKRNFPFVAHLKELGAARQEAGAEMVDFLNRW